MATRLIITRVKSFLSSSCTSFFNLFYKYATTALFSFFTSSMVGNMFAVALFAIRCLAFSPFCSRLMSWSICPIKTGKFTKFELEAIDGHKNSLRNTFKRCKLFRLVVAALI